MTALIAAITAVLTWIDAEPGALRRAVDPGIRILLGGAVVITLGAWTRARIARDASRGVHVEGARPRRLRRLLASPVLETATMLATYKVLQNVVADARTPTAARVAGTFLVALFIAWFLHRHVVPALRAVAKPPGSATT